MLRNLRRRRGSLWGCLGLAQRHLLRLAKVEKVVIFKYNLAVTTF